MENVTEKAVASATKVTTPDHVVARKNYAEAKRGEYGARKAYAESLNAFFPEESYDEHWYAVNAQKETHEFAKRVRGERDAFYEVAKEVGLKDGTARKAWSDIKGYAKILREGEPEKGGNEGRPLDVYLSDEGLNMYKRIAKADQRSDTAKEYLTFLKKVLPKQGHDLSKI